VRIKKYLDIEEWNNILQIWLNGYLDIVSVERRNQISPIRYSRKIILIFKISLSNFLKFFIKNDLPKNKVWFFSISDNNFRSLNPIKESVEDSIFVSPFSFNKQNNAVYYLNFTFKFFYDLIFPISLLGYSLTNKFSNVRYFDLFFKANGSFNESLRLLRRYKPKGIIFANDHEIIPRAILSAAKELNIKTFYVQHASVSKYFPPLGFDYALLEGEDAKQKYLEIGKTRTKIELIGMPKFDEFAQFVNINTKVRAVGIAYNSMDDLLIVESIFRQLKNNFPDLEFKVRPHPSDKRRSPFNRNDISNPREESSFDFLKKIDALIAADSSIHLEAVLLNVYSLSYSFNKEETKDYYGFILNGLIEHYNDYTELKTKLFSLKQVKPNVQQRASYYNAAIGSDFYGKSVKLASEFIENNL